MEQDKKTKLELKLLMFVDCFSDGLDIFTSHLVSFKLKSL